MKNNLFIGLLIGLLVCFVSLVLLDGVFYIVEKNTGKNMLGALEIWALSIAFNLFLVRKYILKPETQNTGKGILLAMFLWGLGYLYLHVTKIHTLFFS